MVQRKKGEAYIDTVISVFLGLIILYFGLNAFIFTVKYSKLNNVAERMLEQCVLSGTASTDFVDEQCGDFVEASGFRMDDLTISFSGTRYYSSGDSENRVQYGDPITLSVSTSQSFALVQSGVVSFPISVSKSKDSQKFWRTAETNVALNPDRGSAPADGAVYSDTDYQYTYQESMGGWKVSLKNESKNKTSMGAILESIDGRPVVSIDNTFKGCSNLVKTPSLPNSILSMKSAFEECSSLQEITNIPTSVTTMVSAFNGCTVLKSVTGLEKASNLKNMAYAFYNCTSLRIVPGLPDSVTSMPYAFAECGSLTDGGKMPEKVANLEGAFMGCISMTKAPSFQKSKNILNLNKAFYGCDSLLRVDDVPNTVLSMNTTFAHCRKLESAPAIPGTVQDITNCFRSCHKLKGTVVIDANPAAFENCFFECARTQNETIWLTGASWSSTKRSLKVTGYNKGQYINTDSIHSLAGTTWTLKNTIYSTGMEGRGDIAINIEYEGKCFTHFSVNALLYGHEFNVYSEQDSEYVVLESYTVDENDVLISCTFDHPPTFRITGGEFSDNEAVIAWLQANAIRR